MFKQIFLLLIFIFVILPIILFGVVIADVYLTVSGFDINQVQIDIGTPSVSLSSDNTSLDFSTTVNVTLPKAGFIPKGVSITFQLFQNTTALGDPSTITIELGNSVSNVINQSIALTQDMTDSITAGGSISIILKSSAKMEVFGYPIPYDIAIPDQTFQIP